MKFQLTQWMLLAALNDELSDIWRAKRGLEVVSFNINSLSIPEDQEKKITEWEENAMTMNQTVAASQFGLVPRLQL